MDNSYCSADSRSPYDCNCYYWTIVIALLLSAIRQLCGSLIALRLQLLLLDNSYCSADSRSPYDCNCYYWTIVIALLLSAIRQLYRPTTAIVTIGQ
ncbi:MAG: hypothetical protein SWX82_08995 [Cyanobacteriota bacterium]|nr:hypothetical protein [Cyanobacteriota bacterium]